MFTLSDGVERPDTNVWMDASSTEIRYGGYDTLQIKKNTNLEMNAQ